MPLLPLPSLTQLLLPSSEENTVSGAVGRMEGTPPWKGCYCEQVVDEFAMAAGYGDLPIHVIDGMPCGNLLSQFMGVARQSHNSLQLLR
jgi:hypothetical protein